MADAERACICEHDRNLHRNGETECGGCKCEEYRERTSADVTDGVTKGDNVQQDAAAVTDGKAE